MTAGDGKDLDLEGVKEWFYFTIVLFIAMVAVFIMGWFIVVKLGWIL